MLKPTVFITSALTPCPDSRCLLLISHVTSPLGDLPGIPNLTPLKLNFCFLPFSLKQVYFTLSFPLATNGDAILLGLVTQARIPGVLSGFSASQAPVQGISESCCSYLQTVSRIEQLFFFFATFVTTLLVKVIITGLYLSMLTFLQFILNAEARLSF